MQKTDRKDIKFSIIMPTYNRAFCIEKAIDSVMAQTYQEFELVIVDDGSTDDTEDVIRAKYSKELESKKIVYKKIENGGVCKARNCGQTLAQNDWVAYLDSDNQMRPIYLEEFRNHIVNYPKYQMFYAQYKRSDGKLWGDKFSYSKMCKLNLIDMNVLCHHRELILKYGGFDTNMKRLVDWDLALKYAWNSKPYFIEKVLVDYCSDDNIARITNSVNYEEAISYLKHKIERYYTPFPQNILSLKTAHDKNHKLFILFGIRIRIKRNKK